MRQMSFYCRSYCLLNMFRAPLCPSSGAREYYTSDCCLSYLVLGFQVDGIVCSCGLCVRFAGCCTGHTTLNYTLYWQLENQAPNTTDINHLYNTLELLMMDIMVPETCWASSKICNKNSSVAYSWYFISTYNRWLFWSFPRQVLPSCLPYTYLCRPNICFHNIIFIQKSLFI
jgi:hypothetical protein